MDAGAIVGIVIGCLVGAVVVIYLFTRWRGSTIGGYQTGEANEMTKTEIKLGMQQSPDAIGAQPPPIDRKKEWYA